MLKTDEPMELNSKAIDQGYRNCRIATKKFFKGQLWCINNLPGDQRKGIDPLLFLLMRTIGMLDLGSADGSSLDVWQEMRDDVNNAFNDQCASEELAALVDASRKFDVPKQHLIDPSQSAEQWSQNKKFKTFKELESFCSSIGGSALVAAMPVLGVIKPDYEDDAMRCGKAIMLTMILANCVNDMKLNKVFIAEEDLDDCEVDVQLLKLRRPSKSLQYLARLYVTRIERMLIDSRRLVQHLDFDGKRSLKSLLALVWNLLVKMKVEPECILNEEGVLSGRELLWLKSRHLMGIETGLPIIEDAPEDHH